MRHYPQVAAIDYCADFVLKKRCLASALQHSVKHFSKIFCRWCYDRQVRIGLMMMTTTSFALHDTVDRSNRARGCSGSTDERGCDH